MTVFKEGASKKKLKVNEVIGAGLWPKKISVLIRRDSTELTVSLHVHIKKRPWKDTARRQPSESQEESPSGTNHAGSLIDLSSSSMSWWVVVSWRMSVVK